MRLLIAASQDMHRLQWLCEELGWNVQAVTDGQSAMALLGRETFDLLLLHACLSGMDGLAAGEAYAALYPFCPPRILLIQPEDWPRPPWADGVLPLCILPEKSCRLLQIMSEKPLPKLAAAQEEEALHLADSFLGEIGFSPAYTGYRYARWLLCCLCRSTRGETQPLKYLYTACARVFSTTSGAVERSLRLAVENVFTHGDLAGIERYFGATVDPERGKPTNRAFLLQGAQQLRLMALHSFTATRSPNSREMHHSPAAPTTV